CASEAPTVKIDRLQHLTAFANAHATLVGDVRVPDGVFRIEANAVWYASGEVGPHPPVRQAAVSRDVEGSEFLAIGLGHNQGRVVGRHHHAIWECDAIGYPPGRAIRGDQSDNAGCELAAWKVKAHVVDV